MTETDEENHQYEMCPKCGYILCRDCYVYAKFTKCPRCDKPLHAFRRVSSKKIREEIQRLRDEDDPSEAWKKQ